MTFATGIPVLYVFAFLSCFILYWVSKVMLVLFYSKTTKFNEELPMAAMKYIKYGLLLHGIFALAVYTNNDLFPQQDTYSDSGMNFDDVIKDEYAQGSIKALRIFGDKNNAAHLFNHWLKLKDNIQFRFFKREYSSYYFLFWLSVLAYFLIKGPFYWLFRPSLSGLEMAYQALHPQLQALLGTLPVVYAAQAFKSSKVPGVIAAMGFYGVVMLYYSLRKL